MSNLWIVKYSRLGEKISFHIEAENNPDENLIARRIISHIRELNDINIIESSRRGAPDTDRLATYKAEIISVTRESN